MGREVVSFPYDGPAMVRCSAHKKTGEQCKKWAIRGGTVCRFHGGAAGQVKRKAQQRLEAASDRLARALLEIAVSADSEAVRLAAIKDALDRIGITGKQVVQVEGTAPWQVLMQKIVVRATPEELADDAVVVGEWTEPYDDTASHHDPLPPDADREPAVPRDAGPSSMTFDDYPPAHIDPDHVVRARRGHTKFSR